jgi:hypothetical protein
MAMNMQLLKSISNDLGIELPVLTDEAEIKEKLAEYINYLIANNFQHLVYLLYRIDINEVKLKHILKENTGDDAGKLIAQLIIERQRQKLITRELFKKNYPGESDEEKW